MPTLLAAKLIIPLLRDSSVPRLQLLRGSERASRLTLVCAPAGFGKTTLVVQQLEAWRARLRAGWLTLDADDNDPVRFLCYLCAAIDTLWPGVAETTRVLVQEAHTTPVKTALTTLLNALEALLQAPQDMGAVLVVEDYHVIGSPAIHEAFAYLVEHLPPGFFIILTSRSEPQLPLARWRARNLLSEVRAEQLRFSEGETASFFNQTIGLGLESDEIMTLYRRTEGWITGLLFAALSLQRQELRQSGGFTGTNRYVADYLLAEVFERQTPAVQRCLLYTSIVEQLCPGLCEALLAASETGWDAQALEQLARSELLFTPIDGEWYRYHSLFREFLAQELMRRERALVPILHQRAMAWFEQHGDLEAAIFHGLQSGDIQQSARLIEQAAPVVIRRGDFATLQGWLKHLPHAVVMARPGLCLSQMWLLLDLNRPRELVSYAEQLEALATGEQPALLAELYVLRAVAAAMNDAPERASVFAQQAQQMQSAHDPFTRALIAYGLGAAYKMGNQGEQAELCLSEAAVAANAAESAYLALTAYSDLGDLQYDRGRLVASEQSFRRALERLSQATGEVHPWAGWCYWGLGRIHYEWNTLESALGEARQAVALCMGWDNHALLVRSLLLCMQIAQAQGNAAEAVHLLDEAGRVAQQSSDETLLRLIGWRRVLLALAHRDHGTARRLIEARDKQQDPPAFYQAFVLARVCLAEGQPRHALEYLKQVKEGLSATNLVRVHLQALITEALAYRAQGQRTQALVALEQALVLAEPGQYLRTFLEEGAPMQELLRAEAAAQVTPAYVRRLLAAFGEAAPAASAVKLTERERQILRMIAAGLSNQEMATQLIIAETTLKRHVSNLYLKLDVHSRTQALARAIELLIL